jgi:isopenicillin N synthase-like dioxygenase
MTSLAENILKVIAMTLNLDKDYFQSYCHEPAAVLRPLHYPPQPADASEDERGRFLSPQKVRMTETADLST